MCILGKCIAIKCIILGRKGIYCIVWWLPSATIHALSVHFMELDFHYQFIWFYWILILQKFVARKLICLICIVCLDRHVSALMSGQFNINCQCIYFSSLHKVLWIPLQQRILLGFDGINVVCIVCTIYTFSYMIFWLMLMLGKVMLYLWVFFSLKFKLFSRFICTFIIWFNFFYIKNICIGEICLTIHIRYIIYCFLKQKKKF